MKVINAITGPVRVVNKRPKARKVAIAMAVQGVHDLHIRRALGVSPAAFRSLRKAILTDQRGLWA